MTVIEDIDLADGIYDGDPVWEGMIRNPLTSLTAAAIPVKPPGAWFGNPNFQHLEPLTVTADGQIAGHIASWREDHIGMSGRVKAPKSKSGYAFFATGALETAEGNLVNVGQITLTGGHAPLEASVAEAVAHYDNTNSAFADVAVGEDKHGIWVAGALRPTVDDNALRAIRASSVSGDWRPINGSLEMVAVCAVNVPGFPIPRARVAAGVPVALVAAGTGELVDLMLHQDSSALVIAQASYEDRLRFIENVVLGQVGDSRETLTAAVEVARRSFDEPDLEGRLAAMRASVHPERAIAASALRDRVHPERTVIAAGLRDRVHGLTAAALRERVHGGGGAVPFREGSPALTAATPFAEDMHPRGRDGQFIEKLGIVELFDVKGAKPGQRGKVTQIVPTKQKGRPDIIVELQNDDGSIGKSVKVKPDNIASAPEKARLPGQGGPGGPALREAGNVYVGEKIMLPGDLEGTVISTEPVGDRDGMRITTDMGVMDLRMSDTVTVVPDEGGGGAPGPAPGSVNLPDGTPLEPGSQVELNGEVFTVNALEPDPANPGGGLAELDDGSGMPSASKGWYNVDQLAQPGGGSSDNFPEGPGRYMGGGTSFPEGTDVKQMEAGLRKALGDGRIKAEIDYNNPLIWNIRGGDGAPLGWIAKSGGDYHPAGDGTTPPQESRKDTAKTGLKMMEMNGLDPTKTSVINAEVKNGSLGKRHGDALKLALEEWKASGGGTPFKEWLDEPAVEPAPAPARPRPGLGPRREPRRPSGGIDWSQEPKGLGEGATEFNPSTGEVTPAPDVFGNTAHNYAPEPPAGSKPTRYAQFDSKEKALGWGTEFNMENKPKTPPDVALDNVRAHSNGWRSARQDDELTVMRDNLIAARDEGGLDATELANVERVIQVLDEDLANRKKMATPGGTLPTPIAPASAAVTADAMWDDGMPIDMDIRECVQASLRARVKGGIVARATSEWTAKEREKAAGRGAAMPGGRFPIKDCTDVGKAVRALGRAKGDKAAVKRHIKKRAMALGCMSNVPDDWK